ncbi:MAG TPA: hemerythrin family protein [Terracidiphilus sp.]|nr:hemerythrin family protein [Terracidiphilus sp.]
MADVASHAHAIAGVQAMDDQHGILVESLNTIGQQLTRGRSATRLAEQIARMAEFTDMHFGCEESLLRRHGYPRLAEHREAHQNLMGQIKLAMQRAEQGEYVELQRIVTSVRGQYVEHVEELDRDYSLWLNARGVH